MANLRQTLITEDSKLYVYICCDNCEDGKVKHLHSDWYDQWESYSTCDQCEDGYVLLDDPIDYFLGNVEFPMHGKIEAHEVYIHSVLNIGDDFTNLNYCLINFEFLK